jgi:glutathione synthase
MTIRLGVVMDPVDSIHSKKDTTLAILREAKKRGWQLYYFQCENLYLYEGKAYGEARALDIFDDDANWYGLGELHDLSLAELDVILMRKDPPVDSIYLYTTYILEYAKRDGVFVANCPRALRDVNEKIFAAEFQNCIPKNIVTASKHKLQQFLAHHDDIVCKPLGGMAGQSVFRVRRDDVNVPVIFESLTQHGKCQIMAQQFIPDIKNGDKRIIMIDGEPIPYALARVPQGDEWRGNLAVGAKGVVQPLTERDRFICREVGASLRERGLYFVGIDVIGDYLTEINVTSPTGVREIDAATGLNVSAIFLDCVAQKLKR